MNIEDAWIKAAFEHVTLRIQYYSGRTKGEITIREVEPDYVGVDRRGRNYAYWGICRLRGRRNRSFKPDSILGWEYVGDVFTPNPRGRWRELEPLYRARKLDAVSW